MEHVTRRLFLGAAGVTVGAYVLGEAPAAASSAPLTRFVFSPLVGTTATLSGPAGQLNVILEQVSDLIGAMAGSDRQFSLIFRPVGPAVLPDGIYTVSHARIGQPTMFLSRVDRGANLRYQAIVNSATVGRAAIMNPIPRKRSAPVTRHHLGAKK